MNPRTKAALIGGVVAGLLSALPLLNNCCCLWAIGGGILAVFLYVKGTGATVTPGQGASLGAMAGGIGAAINLVIGIPVILLFGAAAMTERMEQGGISLPFSGTILLIVVGIVFAIGVFVFTLLGGVIGAPIFGKGGGATAPPPPPPPPGGFGGGPGV
ncbi:MAG: hypothetical protein M3444_03210 [Acidobacteriota bacterium]|nr:hypothetical protein [Acidobacteriota bacterium]MDQ5835667.1 hypothetical protein [Acidobacteriota bacterium]